MKILAIGNSFSEDALFYLPAIARADGGPELTLGNLSLGGCTLQIHAENLSLPAEKPGPYTYFQNDGAVWHASPGASLLSALLDQSWNLVTLQQASGFSGVASSYRPHLHRLITGLRTYLPDDCRLGWHMTWAYAKDSDHDAFSYYRRDQSVMERAIRASFESEVIPTDAFSLLLPSGIAIQKAREGVIGDRLTRDGYHLNRLGRLIAGYTWYAALTQKSPGRHIWTPDGLTLTDAEADCLQRAVTAACTDPLASLLA